MYFATKFVNLIVSPIDVFAIKTLKGSDLHESNSNFMAFLGLKG